MARRSGASGERRGVRLYLSILAGEFPGWVGLNLLFLLTCLPVVTLGPALSALGLVLGRMAEGGGGELARTYWRAFRARFLPKLGWGLAFLAANAALWTAVWFYCAVGGAGLSLAGLSLAAALCLWGVGLHLFPSLCGDPPPERPLASACLAFLAALPRSVLAVAIALALLAAQVLLFPAVLPLTLAGGAVLPGLVLALPRRAR